jgi:hypothetical protein
MQQIALFSLDMQQIALFSLDMQQIALLAGYAADCSF